MSAAVSAIVVAIVSAVGAFFAARAGNRRTQEQLHEVHVLVNSQLTRALVRNVELERLLAGHQIEIPPAPDDQTKPTDVDVKED